MPDQSKIRPAAVTTISPASFSPDTQNAFSGVSRNAFGVEPVDASDTSSRAPRRALLRIQQLVEIVADPQIHAHPPRRHVAVEDEPRESRVGPCVIVHCVGQTQIVGRYEIGDIAYNVRDNRAALREPFGERRPGWGQDGSHG